MSIATLLPPRALSRAEASGLTDDELIAEQRAFAAARRLLDAGAAAIAAEIEHRSRRELGSDGLAQSRGARSGDGLIAQITGGSIRDARTLVRVGALLSDPAAWLSPVAEAVTAGTLSLEGADAIRVGLRDDDRVSASALSEAASRLVDESSGLTLEQLARRARDARTALDTAGVVERESELRDRRFLALTPLPDGMTRVSGLFDPESAAIITGALDAITAPRRGGPRFVDPSSAPEPDADVADGRTVPQLLIDALVDVVKLATLADGSVAAARLFGKRRIGLRVHVAHRDLSSGDGFAHVEGQTAAVSVDTARRIACDEGLIPLVLDTKGQVLDVGRLERFHTPPMRLALAARDGGCVIPGCDRPPHWCEAHHIDEWLRDSGSTSVEDAVLLCRHHHMLVHHHAWRIERDAADYWLITTDGSRTALQRTNPIGARLALARTG